MSLCELMPSLEAIGSPESCERRIVGVGPCGGCPKTPKTAVGQFRFNLFHYLYCGRPLRAPSVKRRRMRTGRRFSPVTPCGARLDRESRGPVRSVTPQELDALRRAIAYRVSS